MLHSLKDHPDSVCWWFLPWLVPVERKSSFLFSKHNTKKLSDPNDFCYKVFLGGLQEHVCVSQISYSTTATSLSFCFFSTLYLGSALMSFLVSRTRTVLETNLPTRLMTAITEQKMVRLVLTCNWLTVKMESCDWWNILTNQNLTVGQKTLRKTISKMMARMLTIPVITMGSIIPGWARLQIRQKWNKMLMKRNPWIW